MGVQYMKEQFIFSGYAFLTFNIANTATNTSKETALERDDLTLQLLMFVTVEKERQMFRIFILSCFCWLLSPRV